jgi:hypothetical protein
VVLFAGPLAFGQNDRATVSGTVSDPSGAMMTGIQVLVTQTATGTNYIGTTNSDGIYVIPGLPIGTYTLQISHSGFKDYVQTDIILIAAQVLQLNVRMAVGSGGETVTVTGGAPLLETETSTVSMTMEESALRDLPLNAIGGRDAMNLLLATTPLVSTAQGGQAVANGVQNWNMFAGQMSMTNSVYVDGMESTTGTQGQTATPGLDALSEVQIIVSPNDAQFGTGGGVELFQIKSGTNKFHGSAFEILQNEDLNANTWANKYYVAQCASSDLVCRSDGSRGRNRFNDYGFSAGGPIWKNHTFIFGDFEEYNYTNDQITPNSETVPTTKMLTGDFSELLTEGGQQGNIPGPGGTPWINPCTGLPYQYGQIFDPLTQKVVNGATCATPFPGNVIPNGLSSVSQKISAIYSQYYKPTISSRIYNNFPSMVSNNPNLTKRTIDLKLDHAFSARHHLSAGLDYVSWNSLAPLSSGIDYSLNAGPFTSEDRATFPNTMYRIVDNYTFTQNLLNTFGMGFAENHATTAPQNAVNPTDYGLPNTDAKYFPAIGFGGSVNGIAESPIGSNYEAHYNQNAYQYQDTVEWNKGHHTLKFGLAFKAQQMNTVWGGNVQSYNFANNTGGPTDPGLTPYVGFAFANEMLGDVQSASTNVNNAAYPRQKLFNLFVQDDYKATAKLILNVGLRWDVTLPSHDKEGLRDNFDLTAQNPLWAPYMGAWAFSKNSGTTFDTSEDYHQFGPHLGGSYRLTDKLVARASYGLFFVPINTMTTTQGGPTGGAVPSTNTTFAFPISQVLNNVPGSTAFNWTSGYPGVNILYPQTSTTTVIPATMVPLYTAPDELHLGYTQNWYIGTEYEMTKNTILALSYIANRGRNLHDPGRSLYRNFPSFNVYQPLLLAGNINAPITNATDAAAVGVPYPYAGFNGPAYAAIAPFPQLASVGSFVQVYGDPSDSAVSAFDSFVAEVKARGYHGLYLDFSYTMSKMTGSMVGLSGWANNWSDPAQNMDDHQDEKHWVQSYDQRNLARGYATYLLPFGRGKQWLSGSSMLLNQIVGGWELGYYGSYGSGMPLGPISSTYQLPYFFNIPYGSGQRVNFSPGQTANSLHNHFGHHLDLANVGDPSNNDFNPNLFAVTSAEAPFGNTPYTFNHWRWNPGVASENLSVLKHFTIGTKERVKAILGAQFFDVFNRHYYGAPSLAFGSPTFGQVTSVYGNRSGQVSARVEW